jgi:arylformamidase
MTHLWNTGQSRLTLNLMIHDISPPINALLAVWPGDTPVHRDVALDLANGDSVTLSSLRATVHLGAHADAPSHYGLGAPTIDERPVDLYVGPCRVYHLHTPRSHRIRLEDLNWPIDASRVLLRTGTFPDPTVFNTDFAALDPELVRSLRREGVRLIGIDTPSVDLFESKDLPAHHAFLECDMAILEGLRLDHVPAGLYELIALPLHLVGFDASPVRAILRTLSP